MENLLSIPKDIIDVLSEKHLAVLNGGGDSTEINDAKKCTTVDGGNKCTVVNNKGNCVVLNNALICSGVNNKKSCTIIVEPVKPTKPFLPGDSIPGRPKIGI